MTVQVLLDLVQSKRPLVLFLMETKMNSQGMEAIRVKLDYDNVFVVNSVGFSGGLGLFWKNEVELFITSFCSNFIDSTVVLNNPPHIWRFTGFYGCPERSRRRVS